MTTQRVLRRKPLFVTLAMVVIAGALLAMLAGTALANHDAEHSISTDELNFVTDEGGANPDDQNFEYGTGNAASCGNGDVLVDNDGDGWLSVDPTEFNASTFPLLITVSVDITGLDPDDYQGSVTIDTSPPTACDDLTVTVNLTVNATTGTTGTIDLNDANGGELILGDTMTVTVTDADLNTDSGSAQSVDVTVTSDSDGTGLTALTLDETGDDTGVFTCTFKLAGATNDAVDPPELEAAVGDTVTATYDDVLDANGDDPAPVTASDTVDPTGATGTISLTDLNGGMLLLGETLRVRVTDADLNIDSGTAQAVGVNVKSSTAATGFTLVLIETGANTGVFEGTFTIIAGATNSGALQLQAADGDTVTATYDDVLDANGLNPAPVIDRDTVGAQEVRLLGNGKDIICHIPHGNPGNAHAISVGAPAAAAHLAHGDTLGAC